MTENKNNRTLTSRQKKITAAAVIGTLILGSGTVALTNRDRADQSENKPKVSKVSKAKGSKVKKGKNNYSKKKNSEDAATDVFSTFGLDVPTVESSDGERGRSTVLSPTEIQTMATTLGANRKEKATPKANQPLYSDRLSKPVVSPTASMKPEKNEDIKKKPSTDEKPSDRPVVEETEEPMVLPPIVVKTTPIIELSHQEVIVQEGQPFDLTSYFSVRDPGDPSPTISYSKTDLVPGNNDIYIYVTNKFGNTASAKLRVFLNRAPVITATESVVDVSIHTTVDLKSLVTAVDSEEGDLTDKIEVSGTPDMEKEGTYPVVYNVSDSKGGSAKPVTVEIHVVNEKPEIHAPDREVSISEDTIDLLEGITVTDKEDDRDGFPICLTTENILEGSVDLTKEGEYVIKVGNVKDRDGKAADDVEFKVKVTNFAPEVTVPVLELHVGDAFDQAAYKKSIVFSDKEDSKLGLTPTLEVTQSDLDAVSTSKPGVYNVTIVVTDSMGKSTTISGVIKVVA